MPPINSAGSLRDRHRHPRHWYSLSSVIPRGRGHGGVRHNHQHWSYGSVKASLMAILPDIDRGSDGSENNFDFVWRNKLHDLKLENLKIASVDDSAEEKTEENEDLESANTNSLKEDMEKLAISGPPTVLGTKSNSERCTEEKAWSASRIIVPSIFPHTKVADGPSSLLPAFSTSSSATGSIPNSSGNDQQKVNIPAEDQLFKSRVEATDSCSIDTTASTSHLREMTLSIDLV